MAAPVAFMGRRTGVPLFLVILSSAVVCGGFSWGLQENSEARSFVLLIPKGSGIGLSRSVQPGGVEPASWAGSEQFAGSSQESPGRAAAAFFAFAAGAVAVLSAFGSRRSRSSPRGFSSLSRGVPHPRRATAAADVEMPAPPELPDEFPPAVIIGGGRLGEAFYNMGLGNDVIVRRGEVFPADAPSEGPIYVCTRNDVLKDIIAMVPVERREDLVFVQNGVILPFLKEELGPTVGATILLVYFAVAKKGEPPLDGKTDTDPKGLSAVNALGKWSREVAWRLQTSGLSCRILREPYFGQAYWEKNLWIAAYMLTGALHDGCKVGDVESLHSKEVSELILELATAVSAANPDVRWDQLRLCERLAAYARTVAHFPTAVKEFEWRNGPFYDITLKAGAVGRPDPCPQHTAGLRTLGFVQ
ncbi:unnamed protein product [Polarella glacialis]|uniref:Uncharacterized protein n=2 Tax=Polarella glacialis TaxID=89957 RepID=A0A813DXF6_POLGL|nr:unnamed protein product [Polarella glacialis]